MAEFAKDFTREQEWGTFARIEEGIRMVVVAWWTAEDAARVKTNVKFL